MAGIKALRIRVIGVVQGVGFRPFVYRLASGMGLRGFVRNLGGSEVEIHVEGCEGSVERFLEALLKERPPPAKVEEVKVEEVRPAGYEGFSILPSAKLAALRSMIPPDIAVCGDCLREVLDPGSRWYRYPFNSCAWCGPRYSIMYDIPYDRERTSMRSFPLCDDCSSEYNDPRDPRRFHAQGISCPRCGPRVQLLDGRFRRVDAEDPIREAARLVDEGFVVAVKGLGGYHLAALATDDSVLLELRRRKSRPTQPFAIMALNTSVVERIAYLPPEARELLESPERPIVLLPKRDGELSELVAPKLDTVGVMLPYTALHYLLLSCTKDKFLVMTSGNKHGKPMCIDEECAKRQLAGIADYFLVHNREIVNRVDDSVVRITDGRPVMLRRGRGYAPRWLRVPFEVGESVAFGAELQTAGAVSFEDKVVLTQFIGDADDYDTLMDMDRYLRYLTRAYRVRPSTVVVDKHPGYLTRKLGMAWARELGAEVVEVQHHHAHAASLMAEKGVGPDEVRVAVTIDGMGYGDDGKIWGGEVLIASYRSYTRHGHLLEVPQPGGDSATRYPVKMLVGMLSRIMAEDEVIRVLSSRGLLSGLPRGELEARVAYRQASLGKAPLTTSMGRVLDSVSALLKLCVERTYEGEPAIVLEAVARGGRDLGLEARIVERDGSRIVDTAGLLGDLIENLEKPTSDLALSAQLALGRALGNVALSAIRGCRRCGSEVLASGGAAVNSYVVRGLRERLAEEDVELVLPRLYPPGDGGLALGQVVVASQGGGRRIALQL